MNLALIRSIVRQHLRSGNDAALYTNAQIDIAVQSILTRLVDNTRCIRLLSEVALAEGDPALGTLPDGFRPNFLLGARIDGAYSLELISWDEMQEKVERTGTPVYLAWSDPATAEVYPIPDAACTLKLLWVPPATTWTPGTTPDEEEPEEGEEAFVVNIPDDILYQVLPWGPPALLQLREPENAWARQAWAEYLQIEARIRANHAAMGGSRSRPRDRAD